MEPKNCLHPSQRQVNPETLSHITPSELEKAYLLDNNGHSLGRPYGFACHVVGRVKP